MPETVKTRVLIISDTHCAGLSDHSLRDEHERLPFSLPLPSADLLIHCGDLTYTGKIHEYENSLDMIKQIDAPVKLVIAGNHDMSLDKNFVYDHVGRSGAMGAWRRINDNNMAEATWKEARDLWTAPDAQAKRQGVTFLDEGTHQIDLPNGARVNVYASPYTPSFCDWGFAYEHEEDRFNPPKSSLSDAKNIAVNPIPSFTSSSPAIDICMTHGPPHGRLDDVLNGPNAGCPHLLRAIMRARPLIHCFGHIHEGWGGDRVKWSESADHVATTSVSIAECKQTESLSGVAHIEQIDADWESASERHGVFLDFSGAKNTDLKRGKDTLLVNASIMNVRYKPVNAPWVIDIDLPRAD